MAELKGKLEAEIKGRLEEQDHHERVWQKNYMHSLLNISITYISAVIKFKFDIIHVLFGGFSIQASCVQFF